MAEAPAQLGGAEAVRVAGAGGRLASLDVLRGVAIAGMLLVNNPGSWSHVYPPLRHAAWHGWTPADLVFPFFVFIMGTALAFSLRKHARARRRGRNPGGGCGRGQCGGACC
jgi:predicted acyltransferase